MSWLIPRPDETIFTTWLFLRGLGVIYLIAFLSYGTQLRGLIGSRGILPANMYLKAIKAEIGKRAYLDVPTLAWLNSSDLSLQIQWILGAGLAVLLILGIQATPVLVLLWLLYLSLVNVGQVFMGYQWDALLLETGFLAVFLAPPAVAPGQPFFAPAALSVFLLRWLVFRFLWMSGIAKLASGDPTWRDLTAMTFHYHTQPLPTPPAWWMDKLPAGFQKMATLFTLFAELVVPLLFWAPPPVRYAAAALSLALQILILLTGNFGFFNWLTILLCIPLFDDGLIRQLIPSFAAVAPGQGGPAGWPVWILAVVALVEVGVGLLMLALRFWRGDRLLSLFRPVFTVSSAFRLVNSYGLFASMTTVRPEIILEGSDDRQTWRSYEFKYKAGDPKRGLRWVAPFHPRIDWQMWFAALGSYAQSPWFIHFVERLLQGTPEVIDLLAVNPFPQKPPRYLRAYLYDYQFTSREERAASGNVWKRERLGLYLPIVGLEENSPED